MTNKVIALFLASVNC
jgi:hypothetical protein